MTIYIKYKDGIPANVNFYSAQLGFYYIGEIIKPFENFSEINLTKEDIVVGYISTVKKALEILNCKQPKPIDIPEELIDFTCRRSWITTLKEIRKPKENSKFFIKPLEDHKLFDGHVIDKSLLSQRETYGFEGTVKVLASEYVEFVSEYRNFVLNDELVGSKHYKGDFTKAIDYNVVWRAIARYKLAPAAYSIDFGLTANGKTLLVECNDAFSLGSYGLDSILYAKMIKARWEELINGN